MDPKDTKNWEGFECTQLPTSYWVEDNKKLCSRWLIIEHNSWTDITIQNPAEVCSKCTDRIEELIAELKPMIENNYQTLKFEGEDPLSDLQRFQNHLNDLRRVSDSNSESNEKTIEYAKNWLLLLSNLLNSYLGRIYLECQYGGADIEESNLDLLTESDLANNFDRNLNLQRKSSHEEEEKDQLQDSSDIPNSNANSQTQLLDPIKLYGKITNRTGGYEVDGATYNLDEFKLVLDLSESKDVEFISSVYKMERLPDINLVWLWFVPNSNKNVEAFLSNIAPKNLRMLKFGGEAFYEDAFPVDINFYLKGLLNSFTLTTEIVIFENWNFTDSDFEFLIKAGSHIYCFTFQYCRFDLKSEISLEGPAYNIEEISFYHSGTNHDNNWREYPEKLERVIKAIGNSSLKQSLNKIELLCWGVAQKEIEDMQDKYGVSNIEIQSSE